MLSLDVFSVVLLKRHGIYMVFEAFSTVILIASRPPAAIQGFRDSGLSTFNCFNLQVAEARARAATGTTHTQTTRSKTTTTTTTIQNNQDNQNHNPKTTKNCPQMGRKWVPKGSKSASWRPPAGRWRPLGALGAPRQVFDDFWAHLGAHLGLRNQPKMVRK